MGKEYDALKNAYDVRGRVIDKKGRDLTDAHSEVLRLRQTIGFREARIAELEALTGNLKTIYAVREEERDQLAVKIERLRGRLHNCIDIMDEKGCKNPEGNSLMLWEKDWNTLRRILFEGLAEPAEAGEGENDE